MDKEHASAFTKDTIQIGAQELSVLAKLLLQCKNSCTFKAHKSSRLLMHYVVRTAGPAEVPMGAVILILRSLLECRTELC